MHRRTGRQLSWLHEGKDVFRQPQLSGRRRHIIANILPLYHSLRKRHSQLLALSIFFDEDCYYLATSAQFDLLAHDCVWPEESGDENEDDTPITPEIVWTGRDQVRPSTFQINTAKFVVHHSCEVETQGVDGYGASQPGLFGKSV